MALPDCTPYTCSAGANQHLLYVQRKVLVGQIMETEDQESAEFFRKIKERRRRHALATCNWYFCILLICDGRRNTVILFTGQHSQQGMLRRSMS